MTRSYPGFRAGTVSRPDRVRIQRGAPAPASHRGTEACRRRRVRRHRCPSRSARHRVPGGRPRRAARRCRRRDRAPSFPAAAGPGRAARRRPASASGTGRGACARAGRSPRATRGWKVRVAVRRRIGASREAQPPAPSFLTASRKLLTSSEGRLRPASFSP